MAMVTDAAAPANHKNDTKNYSDTYVKRFDLVPYINGKKEMKFFVHSFASYKSNKMVHQLDQTSDSNGIRGMM